MAATDSLLRAGLERHGDELTLTLDPAFQGLPDTAHGGSVLAAFHAVAQASGPRQVTGIYRKRVPLGIPLQLFTSRRPEVLECRLVDASNTPLVEGRVEAPATSSDLRQLDDLPGGLPLPVSSTCFACGVDNRQGLHVRLAYDDRRVWGVWQPRALLRDADGRLATVALTTLLDEAAFWLGALASGESGMTTELEVTLPAPVPFGSAITVAGFRDRVRARADDPRYWDTEVRAWDERGRQVASARITFVAVRGAARRLVTGMLAMNDPACVQRVFPAYTR
jgi:acyl-coenzyme A thioesterase PaaI-like protein